MKKLYVFMTALLAMFAINANAERILYQETYEVGGVPSTWTINGGTGAIATTTASSIFQFSLGNNNGRSAHDFWGKSIYDGITETEYSLSFELRFDALGSNQYNGEVAVFADEAKCMMTNGSLEGKGKDWNNYATRTNCLFSLVQWNDAEKKTQWKINNDESKIFTPKVGATDGTWYLVTLTVNTATKEVTYDIFNYDTQKSEATGTKTMANDATLYATGLYLMDARAYSVYSIDNLKVFLDVEYANKPVIALSALNNSERTYAISFLEGETLHVKGVDGQETTYDYDDVDEGTVTYTTSTSGTLTAWTTAGSMKSAEATVEIVCEPIVLPAPTYTIVGADAGYAKTYQFTIDKKQVLLEPDIFMDFTFEGEGGEGDFTLNNQTSGVSVSVPNKGILKIKTKALGYSEGSSSVVNDIEYVIKHDLDFQHMTGAELAEKGFTKLDDLNEANMGGEHDWTARMRMYFQIATGEKADDNTDIYNNYPVYGANEKGNGGTINGTEYTAKQILDGYNKDGKGWTLDGRTYASIASAEIVERYQMLPSQLTAEKAKTLFAPLVLWNTAAGLEEPGSDAVAAKVNVGIGLIQTGIKGDAQSGSIAVNDVTLSFDGLTDDDLIVISKINGYGAGSVHPQFPASTSVDDAKAQYKAMHLGAVNSTCKGTDTFTLYRIDTALNRVLVLSAKNASGIENLNYNKIVSDHTAPIYNLNGVQMNPNALKKGIYIQQGRKFVVK